ncbi:MAG: hypothetical protein NVSMB52_00920 [Chloroflexota bacterium]
MAYYLPPGNKTDSDSASNFELPSKPAREEIADLKIFWGPEICRLEYLVHLVDTGRVKDDLIPGIA